MRAAALTGRAFCAGAGPVSVAFLGTFIAAVTRTKPARLKGDRGMPADGEEPPRSYGGITQRQLRREVRVRFVKVAEYQHRGIIHYHTRHPARRPR